LYKEYNLTTKKDIKLSDELVEDLRFDALDLYELVSALEDHYGIVITGGDDGEKIPVFL